jgi:hypothetical protein
MAYLLFYQKIIDNQGFMQNNIMDMVIDSYGKNTPNNNNTNNVAAALKLPFNNRSLQKATPNCIEIIRKFKIANIKTLDEFLRFIKDNSIELYFWRQYIEEDIVRNSCVGNGTCGFQLEFLLHWRADHPEPVFTNNDIYMKGLNHITKSEMTKILFIILISCFMIHSITLLVTLINLGLIHQLGNII